MELDYISLGKRIRQLRTNKNLTQEQFAEILNSDQAVISRIENGDKGLSIEFLLKIANSLEASTDDILVDSLVNPHSNQDTDAHYLLLDCTQQETKIIIETMRSLREALKKYTSK